MGFFNFYGLAALVIILISNILYAIFDNSGVSTIHEKKIIIIFEQIGRYGCMLFMIFNFPYTFFGFWFKNAFDIYVIVIGVLLFLYLFGWAVFAKRKCIVKAIWLSATPAALFAFCGIMIVSVPLILCSVIFGICHISISYKTYI